MPASYPRLLVAAALAASSGFPAGVAETTTLQRAPGWTTRSLLASPFATQAAAADDRRVYAISNTTVASYDRRTGRLLASATAPGTEHLNSGFVHDGRLEVLHRFDDPPGSLVWCVRRDGAWWCCFAGYGSDNGRTVLVEYAAGGLDRERRRFTFPDVVIADWDGMSASGGIFSETDLLVSHHHAPVLYRLRVPATGETLEFVEALTCPFPGQGFAADPVTGGLVGIDRPHRRVVFAMPDGE